jgi:hypothetical protein
MYNRDVVQAAYQDLGYQYGWTFMMTPEHTLREAEVAFIGLNPGGGEPDDQYRYDGIWSVEEGNAYFSGWTDGAPMTPIQIQLQHWHSQFGVEPDSSFCAQFVPFRSPNWGGLEKKPEALAFAVGLWAWALSNSPAKLLITMGKKPALYLANLLEARNVAHLGTGWGNQSIDVYEGSGYRIVAMPHPSRFKLFGRGERSEIAQASLKCLV